MKNQLSKNLIELGGKHSLIFKAMEIFLQPNLKY